MPTRCRCLTGTAIDMPRTYRHAPTIIHSDLRRYQRLCLPVASDQCPDRPPRPLDWRSRRPRRTPNRSALAQPTTQIPISLGPHTAGSFLGDFRTPSGVRNSSRERTDRFGAFDGEKQPSSIPGCRLLPPRLGRRDPACQRQTSGEHAAVWSCPRALSPETTA